MERTQQREIEELQGRLHMSDAELKQLALELVPDAEILNDRQELDREQSQGLIGILEGIERGVIARKFRRELAGVR